MKTRGWILPLSFTIGQFQIADLMFLRETRLTNADFYIFKLNPYPLTYHGGMNGIGPAEGIFFDNNTQKWYFGKVPLPFESGIFFLWGEEDDPYYADLQLKDRKNIFYGGFLGIDKIYGWAKIILGVDYAF